MSKNGKKKTQTLCKKHSGNWDYLSENSNVNVETWKHGVAMAWINEWNNNSWKKQWRFNRILCLCGRRKMGTRVTTCCCIKWWGTHENCSCSRWIFPTCNLSTTNPSLHPKSGFENYIKVRNFKKIKLQLKIWMLSRYMYDAWWDLIEIIESHYLRVAPDVCHCLKNA